MLENYCEHSTNECVSRARYRVSAQKMVVVYLTAPSGGLACAPFSAKGLTVSPRTEATQFSRLS